MMNNKQNVENGFVHRNFEDSEVVLELKNVRQYFTSGFGRKKVIIKAVHNVSFQIHKGEVFGLVGESGCGKTTTGRSIIKLYNITDGDIYFKGTRIAAGLRSKKINIKKAHKEITDKKKEVARKLAKYKGDEIKQDATNISFVATEERISDLKKDLDNFITQKENEIADLKKDIILAKIDNKRKGELMQKMQMIFQDPIDSLDPRMTVREIIAEGLVINGITNKEVIQKRVEEVLKLVGLLPEHATRYPHEFSGGQRQRVGIARAIAITPELIIADEPISALDVSIQAQVINLLNQLREDLNLTILFIAHNLSVVKYFCDRIGVMYYGRIVEIATAEELFAHPLHPYTKSLLSAVPLPNPDYEKKRKRIFYNPSLRKYSTDKPVMTEIRPGHFVYASKDELVEYEKELNGLERNPDPTITYELLKRVQSTESSRIQKANMIHLEKNNRNK